MSRQVYRFLIFDLRLITEAYWRQYHFYYSTVHYRRDRNDTVGEFSFGACHSSEGWNPETRKHVLCLY